MYNIFFWSVQIHTDIFWGDNIQTKQNLFTTFDFFCLYGVYRPTRKVFIHMETSSLSVKGCKFLIYARHSWSLSSKDSLACHTYSDTGYTFIMVNSEDPWHSNILPSVWHWSWQCLLLRNKSVSAGIRTPNLPHAGPTNYNICCRLFDVHVLLQILQEWDFLNKMQYVLHNFCQIWYLLMFMSVGWDVKFRPESRITLHTKDRFSGFWRIVGSRGPPGKNFHYLSFTHVAAVLWLEYCRYGVKPKTINQASVICNRLIDSIEIYAVSTMF